MDQELFNRKSDSVTETSLFAPTEKEKKDPSLPLLNKLFSSAQNQTKGHRRSSSDTPPIQPPTHLDYSKDLLYKIALGVKGGDKFYKKLFFLLSNSKMSEKEKEESIGLFVYFLNKKQAPSDLRLDKLHELFDSEWKKRFEKCKPFHCLENFHINQDSEKIDFLIEFLLTENGFLNFPLLSVLKKKITSSSESKKGMLAFDEPLFQQIFYVLSAFEEDRHLVSLLEKITPPTGYPMQRLVCAALKIPITTSLTARDVRHFVLQALFSHCRQKEQGSCFAVFIPIYLKMNDLYRCLHDFEQLIKGYLVQSEENCLTEIPFVQPKLSLEEKTLLLEIDEEGYLYQNKEKVFHLKECAPIWGVCCTLDLSLSDKQIKSISSYLHLQKGINTIKVADLLSILAKIAHTKNPKIEKKVQLESAQLCFLSYFTHPLVAGWERTIASMSELEANINLKELLYRIVVGTFFQFFDQNISKEVKKSKKAFNILIALLQQHMMRLIRFKYDPQTMTHYSSPEGGYVLQSLEGEQWRKVVEANGFMHLIKRVVNNTCADLEKEERLKEKEREELLNLLHSMCDKKLEKIFLNQIQKSLESEVLQATESSALSQSSKPWLLFVGYNSCRMLELYFGSSRTVKKRSFKPKSASDALKHIIDVAKYFKQMGNTYSLPMRITGFHAFSLLFKYFHEMHSLEDVTRQFVVQWEEQAQKACAELYLSSKQAQKLLEQASLKWSFKMYSSISKKIEWIEFKKVIIENLSEKYSLTEVLYLEREVEEWLVEKAPESIAKILFEYLIVFADTNWIQRKQQRNCDVYWGFFYCPFSRSIEFCQTNSARTELRWINKNQFIDREWDVLYHC